MIANIIYLVILMSIFIITILKWPRYQQKKAIISLSIWIVIIFAIISIYSFRYELLNNRIIASIIPEHGYVDSDQSMHFKKAANGHFYIKTQINNISIKFLVDTGASDIVISPHDAKTLNINLENLQYIKKYNTANGIITGAPTTIEKLKIGPFIFKNVPVTINKSEMQESLLGMKALSAFNINIIQDTLTIS